MTSVTSEGNCLKDSSVKERLKKLIKAVQTTRVISDKALVGLAVAFIYVPIVLWLFMWCNIIIALTVSAFSVFGIFRFAKDLKGETEYSLFALSVFVFVLLFLLLKLGVFGGLYEQHYDWFKANAVLSNLINEPHPVYYENTNDNAMLTYYLGMYMLPSVLGKFLGETFAQYFLALEIMIYITIAYLLCIKCCKIKKLWQMFVCGFILLGFSFPSLMLFFFGQLMYALKAPFMENVNVGSDIVIADLSIENPDFTNFTNFDAVGLLALRNIPFSLYAFVPFGSVLLTTVLWYANRDNLKSYMLIWTPMLLYCTMALPYIFIVVAVYFIYQIIKTKPKIKELLSNLLYLPLFFTLFAYFSGYLLSEKEGVSNTFSVLDIRYLPLALGFIAVYILPYFLITFKERSLLYYLTFGMMCVACFFKFGKYNDLMLTGTMPLVVLMIIFSVKTLNKTKIRIILLLSLLLVSSSFEFEYAINNVRYKHNTTFRGSENDFIEEDEPQSSYEEELCIINNRYTYGTMKQFVDRKGNFADDLKYNYFTYDYRDKLFYKYFSRR